MSCSSLASTLDQFIVRLEMTDWSRTMLESVAKYESRRQNVEKLEYEDHRGE